MTPVENPFSNQSQIPPRAFVAGLLIGGAAALLIPLAGRFRMRGRRRVARSLRDVKNSLKDAARGVAEMANEQAARVSRDSAKAYSDAAANAADAASGLYDAGRRRARKEADRFADAVHAAAEVYSRGA